MRQHLGIVLRTPGEESEGGWGNATASVVIAIKHIMEIFQQSP